MRQPLCEVMYYKEVIKRALCNQLTFQKNSVVMLSRLSVTFPLPAGNVKRRPFAKANIRSKYSQKSPRSEGTDVKLPRGDHGGFKLIYRCPPAGIVALFSRLKIYQTIFFLFSSPTCYVLYYLGLIDWNAATGFTAAAGIATMTLVYFSHVTRRMIGLLFLDEEKELVKISFVNFWARREDLVVPMASIEMLDKPNQDYIKKLLVKIYLAEPKRFFFTSLRFGQIHDFELFGKVFGRRVAQQLQSRLSQSQAQDVKEQK